MRPRPIRSAAILLALAVVLGACGGDSDDSSSTTAVVTTTAPEEAAPDLAALGERGPYGVGSVTLDLGGRRLVVWYPAVEGAGVDEPTDSFDITGFLSPALQAQIPGDLDVTYPVASATGAEPATDGPFPVVLFSHGYAGFPEQAVDLTTHLASWGYVVAAPDHVERSLAGLLGTAAQGVTPSTDPEVLAAALDLVEETADGDTTPLTGLVDPERVAVIGHSAGAGAAYQTAASDDRIDAFVAMSLGNGREGEGLGDVPTVPGLVMLGDADGVIPAATTREVFDGLPTPRYLLEIADAGHLVFSDICLIGADEGGLVALIEETGIDIPASLIPLASDGCREEDPPVTDAFGAIDATTVAFLRAELDDDADAAALLVDGPVEVGAAEVTLTAEP